MIGFPLMTRKTFYFDMDSVLTDFDTHCIKLVGKTMIDMTSKEKKLVWNDLLYNNGFYNLEPLEGFEKLKEFILTELIGKADVAILTSTGRLSNHNITTTQKRNWLTDYGLGSIACITVPGKEYKKAYATPDSFLLDDHPENIVEFHNAGGVGYAYYDSTLVDDAIDQMRKFLKG